MTGAAQGIGRGVALRAAADSPAILLVNRAEFSHDVAREAGGEAYGPVSDLETREGARAAISAE